MSHFTEIHDLLHDLEETLIQLNRWDDVHPGEEALLSQVPFAVDTLAPQQWLQWIFIPRMHRAIQLGTLPSGFSMAPYFEECWKDQSGMQPVVDIVKLIDRVCR